MAKASSTSLVKAIVVKEHTPHVSPAARGVARSRRSGRMLAARARTRQVEDLVRLLQLAALDGELVEPPLQEVDQPARDNEHVRTGSMRVGRERGGVEGWRARGRTR